MHITIVYCIHIHHLPYYAVAFINATIGNYFYFTIIITIIYYIYYYYYYYCFILLLGAGIPSRAPLQFKAALALSACLNSTNAMRVGWW